MNNKLQPSFCCLKRQIAQLHKPFASLTVDSRLIARSLSFIPPSRTSSDPNVIPDHHTLRRQTTRNETVSETPRHPVIHRREERGKDRVTSPSDAANAPIFQRVIHVRRVANVTKEGKQVSYSVLVVVGDRHGSAGYASGKAAHPTKAVRKALERAEKNMRYYERYDNRTIFHDIDAKAGRSRIFLRTAAPGHGIRTNNYIHEICRCLGIHDIGAKCHGSTNPLNIVRGTFIALEKQRSPLEISLARGKHVVDVRKYVL